MVKYLAVSKLNNDSLNLLHYTIVRLNLKWKNQTLLFSMKKASNLRMWYFLLTNSVDCFNCTNQNVFRCDRLTLLLQVLTDTLELMFKPIIQIMKTLDSVPHLLQMFIHTLWWKKYNPNWINTCDVNTRKEEDFFFFLIRNEDLPQDQPNATNSIQYCKT